MKAVSRTHVGRVRKQNQDSCLVQQGEYGLYCVADGMGGHRAGDVASRMAVLMLGRVLEDAKPSEEMLRAGIQEINQLEFEEQSKNEDYAGMGTTMTVLWETQDSVILGHVGDSRAYLYRNNALVQVSEDHSLVAEMVKSGAITKEMARVHPYRNVITRAVGSEPEIQVDTMTLDKCRRDRWLLCSDGLTGHVSDDVLERVLGMVDMEEAADQLIELALSAGGRDNVTVLLLEVGT